MIIGSIKVTAKNLITNKDTYRLASLTAISVRRPFLAASLLAVIASVSFIAGFHDLLKANEILGLSIFSLSVFLMGVNVGQLTLLSRDLKGTETANAVWGSPSSLNKARHNLVEAQEVLLEKNNDAI